jgi:peptidyl-prolyl cis-trans isomerase A (cyclophilin A)
MTDFEWSNDCNCLHRTREVIETHDVNVVIQTSVGRMEIVVYAKKAPVSAGAFLTVVDKGLLTRHGAFYRTVRRNDNDHGQPAIDVIQGGVVDPTFSFDGIEHEPTTETGLRHLNGTVSLARSAMEHATGASFFICIGDQLALDTGGARISDGRGFAAFGRVTDGMDTVHVIHQLRTRSSATDGYRRGQMLDPPIRIVHACRK